MHLSRATQILLIGWVAFCAWTVVGFWGYHGVPSLRTERRPFYEVRVVPAHVVARVDTSLPWNEARTTYEQLLRSYMAPIDKRSALVRELTHSQVAALWTALPIQYNGSSAPRPEDPTIRLVDMPERTMAVVSLRGWINQARMDEIELQLRKQLALDRYTPFGSTRFVEYSPWWAPDFIRRSELMISIH